jgi:uncharacterized iron-regulated membrane protein
MASPEHSPLPVPSVELPSEKPRGPITRWMRQPQATWLRRAMFQVHLWSGMILGLYIVVVCVSGSALVFRNDLYNLFESWDKAPTFAQKGFTVRAGYATLSWLGDVHGKLLLGVNGMMANAIGGFLTAAVCVTGLVIWWPGIARWRRALIVTGGVGWKRLNFDLHSAVGFWTFALLFMWGMTGGYFVFPQPFRAVINHFTPIDPPLLPRASVPSQGNVLPQVNSAPPQNNVATKSAGSKADTAPRQTGTAVQGGAAARSPGPFPRRRRRPLTKGGKILQWFSFLHYGNFAGLWVKALWFLLGLSPAILFGTAIVMWWNRVLSPAFWRSRHAKRGWETAPASVATELEWERE